MTTTTVASGLPAQVNLAAYHGDTYSQQFRFLAGDAPLDLTSLTIRASAQGTDRQRTELPVTILGDATDGTILLSLPADGLEPDLYSYDIQATDPAGAINTWVTGHLRMIPDVTQEPTP